MGKNVDTRELEELYEKLKKAACNTKPIRRKIANKLSGKLLGLAKGYTPVKTGFLRNNWAIEANEKNDCLDVEVYNPTEYASYVEDGHRKIDRIGWVEGKFMLSKAEIETKKNAPEIIKKRIETEMRKIGL